MKKYTKPIILGIVVLFIVGIALFTPRLIQVVKDEAKQIIDYTADIFNHKVATADEIQTVEKKNKKEKIEDDLSDNIINLQIGTSELSINTDYTNEVYEIDTLNADKPVDIDLQESTTTLDDKLDIIIDGKNIEDDNTIQLSSLNKNNYIEIKLEYGQFQREYLVQTLPSSFPEIEKHGKSEYEGDYYSNFYIDNNPYIYKMSNEGDIIFYKNVKDGNKNSVTNFAKWNIDDKERYSYFSKDQSGHIDVAGYNYGDFVIMDESYKEIDRVHSLPSEKYNIATNKAETHDFIMIDDNHYMLINYVVDTPNPEDLNGNLKMDTKVLAAYVQEIKDGEVVWEWISTDHPQFYESSVESNDYTNSEKYAADYMHINSLFIDPDDDNVIMSFRNQDAVVKVDKATNEILWRFGGKNDDFGLSDEQKPSKQHHATLTDAGNLLIFDNGTKNKQTRIIEADLDEKNKEVNEYEEFKIDGAYTTFTGSVQKLDEENDVFVIGWGMHRENQRALMSEIDFKNDEVLTEVIEGEIKNDSYRFMKFK